MSEVVWSVVRAVIAVLILLHFAALGALFWVWLERKVSARIQDRLGPTRVGGKFGWLQTIADGIKLIGKEDLMPSGADPFLFKLAPYVAFAAAVCAYIALPFSEGLVAQDLSIAVFFILAVMSAEVFGIILAGYGSGSKWALFGGMREAAQVVSYEVPRALCAVIPVMVAGTMNLQTVAMQQAGWFWNWHIFHDPFTFLAFWVFFVCGTASVKRAPFDLAEAESELVAGFHTEYSGMRFLFFFAAEYASMFAISGIAILLFLGGWNLGIGPWRTPTGLGVLVFLFKGLLLVFLMMWVRWTLPRLRIDQVMQTCLKYLLPISCVLLVGASLWPLVFPGGLVYAVTGKQLLGRPVTVVDEQVASAGW